MKKTNTEPTNETKTEAVTIKAPNIRALEFTTDIRVRAMWREWHSTITIQFDADQFTQADVANLLHRVGLQVGIGEGRHDSKDSAGLGWGTFAISET